MTQIVKTEAGERWAIVFGEHFSLDNLVAMQKGIICVLQSAVTNSEFICSTGDDLYTVLDLLSETLPDSRQAYEYEKYLKSKSSKN